jgi:hypothetical protein
MTVRPTACPAEIAGGACIDAVDDEQTVQMAVIGGYDSVLHCVVASKKIQSHRVC